MRTILNTVAALAAFAGLTGCASRTVGVSPTELRKDAERPEAERIRWPAEYAPSSAAFFVRNEIEIAAPPEVVWAELIAAPAWPEWYEGVDDLWLAGGATRLGPEAVFNWKTMGLALESRVREFEAPHRLAWESRRRVIRGYHAWLLIPTDTGCRVVTEESFHGLLAYMQRVFVPGKLHRLHDVWLRELKRRTEAQAGRGVQS